MADVKGSQEKVAKEKILKLNKYIDGLKTRLNSGKCEPSISAWLKREIALHSKKVELLQGKTT